MKAEINFKYVSYEEKTSSKGNKYCNLAVLQGAKLETLYFPFSASDCAMQELEPFVDCKGTLEITKDRYGLHVTLSDFEEVVK